MIITHNAVRNFTFDYLKVLDVGQLGFSKGELKVTFPRTLQIVNATFQKDDLYSWKCLVKVS